MRRLTGFLVTLLGAALVTSSAAQSPVSSDLLHQRLARNDPQAAQIVHDFPDTARALVTRTYARIAAIPAGGAFADLSVLRALARTWASVWNDQFFVHQVDHFARWTPAERRTKVRVDSLRLAGAAVLTRSGAGAAIVFWRESLSLARSVDDSAGEGAALGNIGVGLWRNGATDSASGYLARSRAVAAAIGDRRTAANALVAEASIAKDAGDLATASTLYQSAIIAHQRIGDDRGVAAGDNNLGLIARARGERPPGLDSGFRLPCGEIAPQDVFRWRRTTSSISPTSTSMPETTPKRRRTTLKHWRSAVNLASGRVPHVRPLRDIGLLAMRRSDFDSARAALTAAVAIFDSTGPAADDVATRTDLATAESAAGSCNRRWRPLVSPTRSRAVPRRRTRWRGLRWLAATSPSSSTPMPKPERDYATAARQFTAAHDSALSADANQGVAELLLRRHEPKRAREILLAVQRQRAATGDVRAMAQASLLLGYAVAGAQATPPRPSTSSTTRPGPFTGLATLPARPPFRRRRANSH